MNVIRLTGAESDTGARARDEFLVRILHFVNKLVLQKGVLVSETKEDFNTNVIKKLLNFEGFSFQCDWFGSMFASNSVRIWHHPEITVDSLPPISDVVLEVHYNGTSFNGEGSLWAFNEDDSWQIAIDYLSRKSPTR